MSSLSLTFSWIILQSWFVSLILTFDIQIFHFNDLTEILCRIKAHLISCRLTRPFCMSSISWEGLTGILAHNNHNYLSLSLIPFFILSAADISKSLHSIYLRLLINLFLSIHRNIYLSLIYDQDFLQFAFHFRLYIYFYRSSLSWLMFFYVAHFNIPLFLAYETAFYFLCFVDIVYLCVTNLYRDYYLPT